MPARRHLARLPSCDIDPLQDAAVLCGIWVCALRPQGAKLFLKHPKFTNAMSDVPDVFIQQNVDFPTVILRRIPEPQQHPHLVERHVERSAMPNEAQAIHLSLCVDAVVPMRALRDRDQALPLVETDRFDGCSAGLCQFADSHVHALKVRA